MQTATAIAQIEPLIEDVETNTTKGEWGSYYAGTDVAAHAVHTRATAAIERLTPVGSTYRERMADVIEGGKHVSEQVLSLAGILRALADDLAAGYLRSVEELIHADLFADFLEMAEELLLKGYKDPAAVLAGSVLEEQLRKLAARDTVEAESPEGKPLKADAMNAMLAKNGTYSKLEQKSVTAWLGLRNAAAHGKYDEYSREQVEALLRDVRAFLIRHSA